MARRSPSALPLVAAAIAGLLLILGVRAALKDDKPGPPGPGPVASSAAPDPTRPPIDTGDCTKITMASSSEKAELLKGMADDYLRSGAKVDGRCVAVEVFSKSSGGAAEALTRGWADADGPRPDVWSPASSSLGVLVKHRTADTPRSALIPDGSPSLAQTPLVIAMPKPMAEKLGWPNKALGWGDVIALSQDPKGWESYGQPLWGAFRLGKTNPNFSTSGLNATIGTYFAATGVSSDLTEDDVRAQKTIDYVKKVEGAVVHYGDTTLTFLGNLQKADDRGEGLTYISAVTVEEKSVWDYNMGNPTGDPKTLGKHAPPKIPLVAIYPKEGTLVSDSPYIVLGAEWVDDAKRKAAADFLKFVQQPEQQKKFEGAAFRSFEGKPGALVAPANGMIPAEPKLVISPPAPAVLDLIQQSWNANRKPARVIMVVDVSGSMNQAVAGTKDSKLELAKRAAIKALDQFSPADELALWVFSTRLDGDLPYRELVPRTVIKDGLPTFKETISGLVGKGGTGLYASTRAAVATAREQYDASRINAVIVLTDGKNEHEDNDLDGLVASLQAEDEARAIRVFPIAYGDQAELGVLRQIADASQGAAYDAKDPASIDKVFTAVVSNF
ncbi:MAG: substrate-binding and VWA domain-containing protein [Mycobacteriales bacterium]